MNILEKIIYTSGLGFRGLDGERSICTTGSVHIRISRFQGFVSEFIYGVMVHIHLCWQGFLRSRLSRIEAL